MPRERISEHDQWELRRKLLDAAPGNGFSRSASEAVVTIPLNQLRLLLDAYARDALSEEALRDYYLALDLRQNGDVVANKLTHDLGRALGMSWEPGAEKAKRQRSAA